MCVELGRRTNDASVGVGGQLAATTSRRRHLYGWQKNEEYFSILDKQKMLCECMKRLNYKGSLMQPSLTANFYPGKYAFGKSKRIDDWDKINCTDGIVIKSSVTQTPTKISNFTCCYFFGIEINPSLILILQLLHSPLKCVYVQKPSSNFLTVEINIDLETFNPVILCARSTILEKIVDFFKWEINTKWKENSIYYNTKAVSCNGTFQDPS